MCVYVYSTTNHGAFVVARGQFSLRSPFSPFIMWVFGCGGKYLYPLNPLPSSILLFSEEGYTVQDIESERQFLAQLVTTC